MKEDTRQGHGHGRVECEVCHTIVQRCRCMESGKTVEWVVCPKCRADKAREQMDRTAALNEKLRELGVSALDRDRKCSACGGEGGYCSGLVRFKECETCRGTGISPRATYGTEG